jgi:hypothetical protein
LSILSIFFREERIMSKSAFGGIVFNGLGEHAAALAHSRYGSAQDWPSEVRNWQRLVHIAHDRFRVDWPEPGLMRVSINDDSERWGAERNYWALISQEDYLAALGGAEGGPINLTRCRGDEPSRPEARLATSQSRPAYR